MVRHRARHGQRARLAAADIEDQPGRDFRPPESRGRIDAALETVAGIGEYAELAPGGGGPHRVEQRDFEEHGRGVLAAAGSLAPHHAADRERAVVIGDHRHRRIERVGASVERGDGLALPGEPHGRVADHLVGVEDMERARQIEGDVVGDVDQSRDRPEPDGGEPVLQPSGAGSVTDIAKHPPDDEGAGIAVIRREIAPPGKRALEPALDRRRIERLEAPHPGRGEVAGDAADARAVGAVGGQPDLDRGIADAERHGRRRAGGKVAFEIDDALMLVRQAELALGAQHAAALDAADLRFLELRPGGGDHASGAREDALHAGARVGRAAHHLESFAAPGIDGADAEPVGVGVRAGLDHVADHEFGERGGRIVDRVDLEPDHRQPFGDRLAPGVGIEMLAQPGQGELHCAIPAATFGMSRAENP